MAEGGDSLSSTLAGLRETGYYDYNIPKHTEIWNNLREGRWFLAHHLIQSWCVCVD